MHINKQLIAAIAMCVTAQVVHAGGPTWCTLNYDCQGYSDVQITKDCCEAVKHTATWTPLSKMCMGGGGTGTHQSNFVDHGEMAKCCHARGARRMCGCAPTWKIHITAKARPATWLEWKTFNLTDRPEPDWRKDPPPLAGAWQIPDGDALVNTLHDKHLRANGEVLRNRDYAKWCKRPQ